MKATTVLLLSYALACSGALALPPSPVLADLNSLKVKKFIVRTDQISAPLRGALAKTFHQKALQLGNPKDLIGGAVTYTGDPERLAPYRRLIFVFETQRYAYIYYEKGDPELSAICLIYDISVPDHPQFVWGGGDLHRPFARNPSDVRERVVRRKLWDDKPYIW
jgi:hypothetical protein